MKAGRGISRRDFLKLASGGIAIFVGLGPGSTPAQNANRLYPEDFNAYLIIGENGRVTVFSGKIEMGQGVMTSQAQMVAEELGVPLSSIDIVLGDTDRCPWDMGTFGSLTTRMFGPVLRAAAAEARSAILALATARLGVPVERLEIRDGIVFVVGEPSQQVGFGALSRGASMARILDRKAVLRAVANFQVMGTSPTRLDGLDKVTGAAKYAADIKLPGMLYARILRPPMHGATLLQSDTSGVASFPGIVLVAREDLIATLHEDPEAAAAALGSIKANWRLPEGKIDQDSIFNVIQARAGVLKEVMQRGDVVAARAGSAHVFQSEYRKGYVAHAPIEPHAALAEIRNGKVTVWASTQTPFPTRDRIARLLGLDARNVRVITPYVGGGFGGKSADEQAIEAVRLAQITGRPVQVAWTRHEEFFHDRFDPASVVKIASTIDGNGHISSWDYVVHAAGERAASIPYEVPNTSIRSGGRISYDPAAPSASVHPFVVGPWRAPGANMNVFAMESQIDVMASAAGMDPLAFRLRNISDARMRRVLRAAADKFGWTAAAAPSGRGVGVACAVDAGTCVATMAEVKVDPDSGQVKVVRVVCALDMGIVVNPEGTRMQIEGGVTMGLGYALAEEVRFMGGEILNRNFNTYSIPRFSWVPQIDAVLVRNDDLAPQGCGEPPITTTGAVLANAVFDATGARLFRLPMSAGRVRQAMLTKMANENKGSPNHFQQRSNKR